jgi:hypothetical protein
MDIPADAYTYAAMRMMGWRHVQHARFQAILLVGVASFLALVVLVIIALHRPFRGDGDIPADSDQLVYDPHMRGVGETRTRGHAPEDQSDA